MFTKEERLFIWEKVYEMIDRLEDGEYICVADKHRRRKGIIAVFNNRFRFYVYSGRDIGR